MRNDAMPEESNKPFGQIGYEAYVAAGDWLAFDSRSMPQWETLSETEAGREAQRRWESAAQTVITAFVAFDGPRVLISRTEATS